MPLRVLIISGIWPPDIGGPASHGPSLGAFLSARGHDVRAITSSDGAAVPAGFPLHELNRGSSLWRRLVTGATSVLRAAREVDVVYATGLYTRSAIAARATRTPLVLKLVNDPAFERARNRGWHHGSLEDFQRERGAFPARMLRHLRRATLDVPRTIVVPSHYLAAYARSWGVPDARLAVVPNPAPPLEVADSRETLRARLGVTGPTAVFAGRFVAQKNLPLLLEAFARVPHGQLVLVGDGPERSPAMALAERLGLNGRARFVSAASRQEALGWMRAADVAVLASAWENFPHALVEALAVGTPLVATAVGGVPEIVEPGVNGLLVPPGDASSLADALASVLGDPAHAQRLRDGAGRTGDRYSEETVFSRIEELLVAAAR
jgi:glycosyltransferase involved in cell wall biosynthesis